MSNSNKLKAVLFDFDGTVANSHETIMGIWKLLFERESINMPDDFCEKCRGKTAKSIGLAYINDQTLREKIVMEYELVEQRCDIELMGGVSDLFNILETKNIKMGIVTSSFRPRVINCLFRHNIPLIKFHILITAEDVKFKKPDPEPYIKALNLLRIEKEMVLAVEDSDSGEQSAILSGIKCIKIKPNMSWTSTIWLEKLSLL